MELGAYATTFIPTTTAAVTRLMDNGQLSDVYTNGLISPVGGTWFIDFNGNFSYTRDAAGNLHLGDNITGTLGNSFTLRNGGPGRLQIGKVIANTLTTLYTTLTDNLKIAIKWNGTTADVFVNGVKVVASTAFTPTQLELLIVAARDVPKYINQSALFPTPLTDAQCIQLTT
jgi:hypothetical protein